MSTAKSRTKDTNKRSDSAKPVAIPQGPDRFYNRELSWLQFNRRVLEEAQNRHHPVLERLRFLSISASNLDEFYMVRAAGLYGQVAAGVTTLSSDGKSAVQQLTEINIFAARLVADKQSCWIDIKQELSQAGIRIVNVTELSGADMTWLEAEFMSHVFPILTPMNVDPAHPFPFIQNKGLTLAIEMANRENKAMSGLIPIPAQVDRFIRLPADVQAPKLIRFIRMETVIGLFISELYPNFKNQTSNNE